MHFGFNLQKYVISGGCKEQPFFRECVFGGTINAQVSSFSVKMYTYRAYVVARGRLPPGRLPKQILYFAS